MSYRDDDTWGAVYTILYEDDDSEELTAKEVALILLPEVGEGESKAAAAVRQREATLWEAAASQLEGPTTVALAFGVLSTANPILHPELVPGCGSGGGALVLSSSKAVSSSISSHSVGVSGGGGGGGKRVYVGFIDVEDDDGETCHHVFDHVNVC